MFKKYLLFFCIFIFFIVACTQEISKPDKLIFDKDIKGSTAIDDPSVLRTDVVGVTIRYHKDGLLNPGLFELSNPYCFYLERLEEIYETNGSEYNYVLYVPDIIKDEYVKAGGSMATWQNPFLSYMDSYYKLLPLDIIDSWYVALQLLFSNYNNLVLPSANDVKPSWTRNYSKLFNVSNYIFDDGQGFYYDSETDTVYYDWKMRSMFFSAYHGSSCSIFDGLFWYLEKYEGKCDEDILKIVEEDQVAEYFNSIDYIFPRLDQIDDYGIIDVKTKIDDDIENYYFGDVIFYLPGHLRDENGQIIEDDSRNFITYRGNGVFFPIMPYRLIDEYEKSGHKWDGRNDIFWYFIYDYANFSPQDVNEMKSFLYKFLDYRYDWE